MQNAMGHKKSETCTVTVLRCVKTIRDAAGMHCRQCNTVPQLHFLFVAHCKIVTAIFLKFMNLRIPQLATPCHFQHFNIENHYSYDIVCVRRIAAVRSLEMMKLTIRNERSSWIQIDVFKSLK